MLAINPKLSFEEQLLATNNEFSKESSGSDSTSHHLFSLFVRVEMHKLISAGWSHKVGM